VTQGTSDKKKDDSGMVSTAKRSVQENIFEHTFGDSGNSSEIFNQKVSSSKKTQPDAMTPFSVDLTAVDITTEDSIFNLHKEQESREESKSKPLGEVYAKANAKDHSNKKAKRKGNRSSLAEIVDKGDYFKHILEGKETHFSAETFQMLRFMREINESWEKHFVVTNLLRKTKPVTVSQELSSKMTHQITQISVFHQLSKAKPDYKLPCKSVSILAKLAKQIVLLEEINIPRQTRSQFTLTVLEMLKSSQDQVKENRIQRAAKDTHLKPS
jgi:hypothetical protein